MGFFRNVGDEFKVQSFVSRLEEANYKFRPDFLVEARSHLNAARDALSDIQSRRLEYRLPSVGWEYIVRMRPSFETRRVATTSRWFRHANTSFRMLLSLWIMSDSVKYHKAVTSTKSQPLPSGCNFLINAGLGRLAQW
jgi:hypothetical protein